ncbi:hypothetical protein CcaverHIS002_0201360 [Cutaneotrichosporon cavernicola]|uniref:Breast carcinoma amplified sequence 2 n=1 Tax=Cutaneotrichosporon cavernicola TaxID=279322 RepID=A0AA48I060_9TREE|nr:uncharacterized protein CcaverHIS019_0201410 [Cutaneotrichosporon cavernicola]BEI80976.1 hypothetical protein CcaverHIS002_0201360 [Cutaneotrichosporon cavernicola]BEI88779.1 hypothetical protein CcaverHIS019_0201410 [Cutaneotrichosporon cavernicola]BEI96554.1 hypothetical protein CcaverHIS631_0201430 [Cutaneotrichosporon cavernicola]BEJ04326.1 hypothetical protein CcaverHIS641_0201430 [Cutaneotrichosporon cavernicola]
MSASIIDALPYYDKQVEAPGAKAKVEALIEAELAQTPRVAEDDPRLGSDVDVFPKSAGLATLLANYADKPIRAIDPSKYAPPAVPEGADFAALEEAETRGRVGEAHMAVRNENIGVLQTYGPNAWLVRNYQLASQAKELDGTLAALKEDVTDVNRQRRAYNEVQGEHLAHLENRWNDLVTSTLQLEMACTAMEGEVRGLEYRADELRAEVAQLEEAL